MAYGEECLVVACLIVAYRFVNVHSFQNARGPPDPTDGREYAPYISTAYSSQPLFRLVSDGGSSSSSRAR